MKITDNAKYTLEKRYLLCDENRVVVETPEMMIKRVADFVGNNSKQKSTFYNLMDRIFFLPNSPTLMNAGTDMGQLSACFVLPVKDDMTGIFDTLYKAAMIHKSGGGTGFNFTLLRPKGDTVGSTKGVASGPASFMRIFDVATDVVRQGGKRRGANMGILDVDHPDILEFIRLKEDVTKFSNFNLSVSVTDKFMHSAINNKNFDLCNPRTGDVVMSVNAGTILDEIVNMSWKVGDPALLFMDTINRYNPTRLVDEINTTNPCGEVPLLHYESCNLGSINLVKMLNSDETGFDSINLSNTIVVAVEFLNNVIDRNKYPFKEIEDATKRTRKIGLGVMGWAEALIRMGIEYNSREALKLASTTMAFIDKCARDHSEYLSMDNNFPAFEDSVWKYTRHGMANATCTSIAPTGSISIIAGTTSGIEPLFALAYKQKVLGTVLTNVFPYFKKVLKDRGLYTKSLIDKVTKQGSVSHISGVPKDIKRLFVTSHDIEPKWHVDMQAAFQEYVDNAVSKTVNLRTDATREIIKKIYIRAWKKGCKGITVYRNNCRDQQVLNVG